MVRAFHIVFGCYGFWLPNDPRGAWSTYVGSRELLFFGRATKTDGRRSVAHRPHDVGRRLAAKGSLKHEAVELTGRQALEAARGFAEAARSGGYAVLACAVMPDHVHLVVGRHERPVRKIAGHFKSQGTKRLRAAGWPSERPVWAAGCWAVFLNSPADVTRAIEYVEMNPVRAGLRRQSWGFVRGGSDGRGAVGEEARRERRG